MRGRRKQGRSPRRSIPAPRTAQSENHGWFKFRGDQKKVQRGGGGVPSVLPNPRREGVRGGQEKAPGTGGSGIADTVPEESREDLPSRPDLRRPDGKDCRAARQDRCIQEKSAQTPMADGLEAALGALKTAEGTLRKVDVDWSSAYLKQKEAEIKQGNVRVEKASLSGNAAQMAKELDESKKGTSLSSQNASDAALQASLENSLRAVVEKEGVLKFKRKDLAGLNLRQVRALMESVSGSLVAAEDRHKKSEKGSD